MMHKLNNMLVKCNYCLTEQFYVITPSESILSNPMDPYFTCTGCLFRQRIIERIEELKVENEALTNELAALRFRFEKVKEFMKERGETFSDE